MVRPTFLDEEIFWIQILEENVNFAKTMEKRVPRIRAMFWEIQELDSWSVLFCGPMFAKSVVELVTMATPGKIFYKIAEYLGFLSFKVPKSKDGRVFFQNSKYFYICFSEIIALSYKTKRDWSMAFQSAWKWPNVSRTDKSEKTNENYENIYDNYVVIITVDVFYYKNSFLKNNYCSPIF